MTKTNALPRPAGAIVLSLLAIALAALVLPASSLAAPLPEGDPALTISPSPAVLPTTTIGNQSQTQEFVVTNAGEAEAWIEKTLISGPDAGEFNLGGSSCNGASLQPGQQCAAWVSFLPSNAGERHAALAFQLNGHPDQSFEISGVGARPHFSFQPGSHDFGLLPIHSEAGRTTFQLENDGEAAAQVGSLNFSGGNSNGFWFGNSNCWGRWMPPGDTCSIEVGFGPNEAGSFATQIQVSANGENFTANLSGEGGRPVVEAFPNPADFGAVTVGSTGAIQTVIVHNSGNVPTSFFIGIIAGGDAGSFQLLDESCSGAPLMPSGSCLAHIRFTPQSAGPKLARLAFFGDSEGGAMVSLSGEGVAAAVTLAPSGHHDFGSVAAGVKSAPQSFAVRNEGGSSIDLASATIVGADLDQFSLSGEDCSGSTLDPGDECVVRIRFTPDSAGTKTARLRVKGDAGTFSAALTGIGGPANAAAALHAVVGSDAAAALDQPGKPRLGRHRGRHRRFSHGDAVASARGRSPRRAHLRASSIPR